MKILTLLLTLIFLNWDSDDFRCTCLIEGNFCEFIQRDFVDVAVQVKVIDLVEYSPTNQAYYAEVLNKYKEDTPITDTIKLYNLLDNHSCGSGANLRINETYILPLSITNTPIINPDSLSENYWETYVHFCTPVYNLKVQSGIVSGYFIIETDEGLTVESREFQLDAFEERLNTCEKIIKDEIISCSADNFIVTPNPASSSSQVKLKLKENDVSVSTIEKIRIFSIDGKIIEEFEGAELNPFREIELKQLNEGINLIEIQCDGERFVKKVIIDK